MAHTTDSISKSLQDLERFRDEGWRWLPWCKPPLLRRRERDMWRQLPASEGRIPRQEASMRPAPTYQSWLRPLSPRVSQYSELLISPSPGRRDYLILENVKYYSWSEVSWSQPGGEMFSWCPLSMLGVVTLYMLDSWRVERHSWELSEEHSSFMSSIPSSEAEILLLQLVFDAILISREAVYTWKLWK